MTDQAGSLWRFAHAAPAGPVCDNQRIASRLLQFLIANAVVIVLSSAIRLMRSDPKLEPLFPGRDVRAAPRSSHLGPRLISSAFAARANALGGRRCL